MEGRKLKKGKEREKARLLSLFNYTSSREYPKRKGEKEDRKKEGKRKGRKKKKKGEK